MILILMKSNAGIYLEILFLFGVLLVSSLNNSFLNSSSSRQSNKSIIPISENQHIIDSSGEHGSSFILQSNKIVRTWELAK